MSDPPPRDAIRSGNDRWAPVYDNDASPLIALEEPVVRVAIGDVRGLAVLVTDPESQAVVQLPGAFRHQIAHFVTAALGGVPAGRHRRAGTGRGPRAPLPARREKYVGWPMLVFLTLGT